MKTRYIIITVAVLAIAVLGMSFAFPGKAPNRGNTGGGGNGTIGPRPSNATIDSEGNIHTTGYDSQYAQTAAGNVVNHAATDNINGYGSSTTYSGSLKPPQL